MLTVDRFRALDKEVVLSCRKTTERPRAYGEKNPNSLLTKEQVDYVREHLKQGAVPRELAELFGVSRSLIYAIRNGRLW